jgi:hypothetical protein
LLRRWFFQHSGAGKTIANAKKTIAGGKFYSLDGFSSIPGAGGTIASAEKTIASSKFYSLDGFSSIPSAEKTIVNAGKTIGRAKFSIGELKTARRGSGQQFARASKMPAACAL